jgi:hypothetical protein
MVIICFINYWDARRGESPVICRPRIPTHSRWAG